MAIQSSNTPLGIPMSWVSLIEVNKVTGCWIWNGRISDESIRQYLIQNGSKNPNYAGRCAKNQYCVHPIHAMKRRTFPRNKR